MVDDRDDDDPDDQKGQKFLGSTPCWNLLHLLPWDAWKACLSMIKRPPFSLSSKVVTILILTFSSSPGSLPLIMKN